VLNVLPVHVLELAGLWMGGTKNELDEVGLVGAGCVEGRSGRSLRAAANESVAGAEKCGECSHGELIESTGQLRRLNGSD
jgi:hypothetical protein